MKRNKKKLKERRLKKKIKQVKARKVQEALAKIAKFKISNNLDVEEVNKVLDEAARNISDKDIVQALGITSEQSLDEQEYDDAKSTFLDIFTEEELGERIKRYFAIRNKKVSGAEKKRRKRTRYTSKKRK